jgi:hypothetical protein
MNIKEFDGGKILAKIENTTRLKVKMEKMEIAELEDKH